MLQLTESAGERLHKSLEATRADDEKEFRCFRIVPKDDRRLTLKVTKPASTDLTIEHEGDVVLAVPKALRPFFKNKNLDIDTTGNLRLC